MTDAARHRHRHPAKRARRVAAGVSVATFAVLAGGLAVGTTASGAKASTTPTSGADGTATTAPAGAGAGTWATPTDGFRPDGPGRHDDDQATTDEADPWGAAPGSSAGSPDGSTAAAPSRPAPSTQSHGS